MFISAAAARPRSALMPYTPLFRSRAGEHDVAPLGIDEDIFDAGQTGEELHFAGRGQALPPPSFEKMQSLAGLTREIGRAHVCTPVTVKTRMPSSACYQKRCPRSLS